MPDNDELVRAEDPELGPRKAYAALRHALAGVHLQLLLLDDIRRLSPDYLADVQLRLRIAIDAAVDEDREVDDLVARGEMDPPSPDWVPLVPFPALAGEDEEVRDARWLAPVAAALAPLGNKGELDLPWLLLSALLVPTHSALEYYAKARGVWRGNLPDSVLPAWEAFSSEATLPTAETVDLRGVRRVPKLGLDDRHALRLLDASRHAVIHNRGIVDAKCAQQGVGSHLQVGERLPLTTATMERYLSLADRIATRLLYHAA